MCDVNDHLEFHKSFKDMYPLELELKKGSISISDTFFLDLSIITGNTIVDSKLFDRRVAFPFFIVSTPILDSNIKYLLGIYRLQNFEIFQSYF